jgi:hypothetical protein
VAARADARGDVRAAGYTLRPRLPLYESYRTRPGWLDPRLAPAVDAAAARLAATPVTMEAHPT